MRLLKRLEWGRKGGVLLGPRAASAPAGELGGDELHELAETFRGTVDRLSGLLHEVETAHEASLHAEVEKKRFYREVLCAVTNGKFMLVDPDELPDPGTLVTELPIVEGQDYAAARDRIQELALECGMPTERAGDLVLAAGEAITNAIKHATDARCLVYRRPDAVVVRVTDRGSGIHAHDLPGAVLIPGFSTKVSLGMGYTLMLQLTDCIELATGPAGTIIQITKKLAPEAEEDFEGLLDRMAESWPDLEAG
jgi:anti-sigma regulatory factor (Ser/Thr protein kinase)